MDVAADVLWNALPTRTQCANASVAALIAVSSSARDAIRDGAVAVVRFRRTVVRPLWSRVTGR